MSEDVKYVSGNGFIQFDVKEPREANGKEVTDVVIKTPGGDGVLLRVSIWEELAEELDERGLWPLEKGDWIAADGKFTINTWDDKDTGAKRSQPQISASSIAVLKGAATPAREVVSSKSKF
jgi:single-stranded DNA-binding protein